MVYSYGHIRTHSRSSNLPSSPNFLFSRVLVSLHGRQLLQRILGTSYALDVQSTNLNRKINDVLHVPSFSSVPTFFKRLSWYFLTTYVLIVSVYLSVDVVTSTRSRNTIPIIFSTRIAIRVQYGMQLYRISVHLVFSIKTDRKPGGSFV